MDHPGNPFLSVRGRTVLYFSLVLSFSIILSSGICYWVFSRRYLSSLEQQNQQRLKALAAQIDSQVLQYTERQFIELVQNEVLYRNVNSLFKNPSYERNVRLYNAVQELKSLVIFSNGVIGSVDLYFSENKTSISSYSGYMDLALEPERRDRDLWEGALRNWKDYTPWGLRQISSYQGNALMYLGIFPAGTVQETRGIAAFAVAPAIFRSYLLTQESQDTKFYFIYEDLSPVYGSPEELEKILAPEELKNIARTRADGMVHRAASASPAMAVSCIRSSQIPAVLVSVVSAAAFREGLGELFSMALLIGVLVFLAGLAATGFVSQRLYRPLKSLVSSISGLGGTRSRRPYQNEYSYINEAIGGLYRKETEYRTALDGYVSAIAGDTEGALKTLNLVDVSEILDHFRRLCGGLDYRGEQCRSYCSRLGSVFYRWFLANGAAEAVVIPPPESCENITGYIEKLREAAGRFFEYLAGQNRQRAALAAKLLAYIGDNLSSPISQHTAAEHCGISASYVSKLVKEETGETWVDYLNNRRLQAAMKLLEDPALKIEDAAKRSGFSGAAYFIKRFKERYGFTPRAYQQEFFNRR